MCKDEEPQDAENKIAGKRLKKTLDPHQTCVIDRLKVMLRL